MDFDQATELIMVLTDLKNEIKVHNIKLDKIIQTLEKGE